MSNSSNKEFEDILGSLPDSNDLKEQLSCDGCGAKAMHRSTYIPPDNWDYRHFYFCDKCIEKINASIYKTLQSFGIARLEMPEGFRDDGLPF